jgi:hypothetical protein
MASNYTHKQCFEEFGAIPKNPRWSWSGRSRDGKTVAVTLWQDGFTNAGKTYRTANKPEDRGVGTPGFNELVDNLKWARDHCDGELHIIVAKAVDVHVDPRSIAECFPSKMKMRLTEFDETTGNFVAERSN